MILVQTAHFTTNVAKLNYTIDLQKSRKKNVTEKLILTMQKQQLGTRWLHLPSVAKRLDLHELENIYLDYLSEHDILIESHITRFGENLIERAQEYEVIIMDKKQGVFRKESTHEMFSISLKASRSWIQSIRTIVQPIRHDIFKHKNSFNGNLTKTFLLFFYHWQV